MIIEWPLKCQFHDPHDMISRSQMAIREDGQSRSRMAVSELVDHDQYQKLPLFMTPNISSRYNDDY